MKGNRRILQDQVPFPLPVLVVTKEGKKYLRVGRGCVLGVNVLPSLLHYIDAPAWKDEVDELGANIGNLTHLTLTYPHINALYRHPYI